MELFISHSFSNTKAKKPWFNSVCSRAVRDREAAHKRYRSHPSAETHTLYISARNHARSIVQFIKSSFINRKCQDLSSSSFSHDFWHLANSISNNFTFSSSSSSSSTRWLHSCLFFSKAELFAQTFAINSTLDDTGHISPTPPSDYFIPKIKILHYDVFCVFSGLDSRNAYGPDGVPPVLQSSLPSWLNSFVCASLLLPILLAGSLLTFNLSLKWVIAPIFQNTAQ